MKQVININFHGQVVPIEVSAFDLLKNYTDSLARFFAKEDGNTNGLAVGTRFSNSKVGAFGVKHTF